VRFHVEGSEVNNPLTYHLALPLDGARHASVQRESKIFTVDEIEFHDIGMRKVFVWLNEDPVASAEA
jgi:hypothetical protein